jgi:thioredoxin reductase
MNTDRDCIVVGAGAAGLCAALVLGRARKRTLVVDAGRPSNVVAHGIGGLLGQDGRPPADFYAAGRKELTEYPSVRVLAGEVVGGERHDGGFALELADGSHETARRVLLATGMDYRYADVPGIAERWGRSAFHCPFCHGWEVREQRLGVLDNGATATHRALLLRTWSDDVTVFTNGPAQIDPEDLARLRQAGVPIEERAVTGLHGPGDTLTAVAVEDGDERACSALLVAVTTHQRSDLAAQLGAVAAAPGPVAADALELDAKYLTNVPGLYAAGDIGAQMQSVALAVAAGSTAAAMVVQGLMAEAYGL